MKKLITIILSLIILIGCQEEVEPEDTLIIPEFQSYTALYTVHLPYQPGIARGYITSRNFGRFDIDQIEHRLMLHSTNYFEPNNFVLQEGQYLTKSIISTWLSNDASVGGLNPENDITISGKKVSNPKYISYILEQNYLDITDKENIHLKGVSLSLVLNPYQIYTNSNGVKSYVKQDPNKVLEYGKDKVNQLISQTREIRGLQNAEVLVGLYVLNAPDSLVPGSYKQLTYDNNSKRDETIINEYSLLFPSSEANSLDQEMNNKFSQFQKKVSNYFPNYTAVIGKGFYSNDQLEKISISIQVTFKGKVEIYGFSQFIANEVNELFNDLYEIEVIINSIDKLEATITKDIDDTLPTIHFYN